MASKTISILSVIAILLSVIAVPLSASAAVSGQAAVGEYIHPERPQGKVDPAYPDFEYTVANGEAKIINYNFNGSMVTFPSKLGGYTVTSIGDSVFYTCTSQVTGVVIPDTVKTIDRLAFFDCINLTSVKIPDSVTSIGLMAFCNCTSLEDFVFPASLETIGNMAFSDCALKNAELPDKVKTIGENAFDGCKAIEKIFIPASVTAIGRRVFSYFDAEDVRESIVVDPANKVYDSRNNCNAIIETATNTLIVGCSKTVIPDSVTAIGEYAFCGSSKLKQITLPDGVNSLGDSAFKCCTALQRIDISDGVNSIGNGAFFKCTSLQKISLPAGLTGIGESVFGDCTALTAIDFPAELSSIGEGAFRGCTSLTSVTFPESLTRISWFAFYGCEALKSVTIPASVEYIGEDAIGYHEAYVLDKDQKYITRSLPMDDFTLYGYYGSGAERYALTSWHGSDHIRFIGLNEMPTSKKVKAELSDGVLLEANDLTGKPATDSSGDPIDMSEKLPGKTVIGAYDLALWNADHRAVPRPEESVLVKIRCSTPDAEVYAYDYGDLVDMKADYDFDSGCFTFSVDQFTKNIKYYIAAPGTDVVIPVCGDADGDGKITSRDVTVSRRHIVMLDTHVDENVLMHGDVDGNGKVNVLDVTLLQRDLVMLDTAYPIGELY